MVTDPIADFLTKMWNATRSGKETVTVPHSNILQAIAELLVTEGYLTSIEKKGKKKSRKQLEVTLRYVNDMPRLSGVRRISKPSRRIYEKSNRLNPVRNGHGRAVLSTPKGLLTDVTARKEHVGGEVLFKIW